jgi:hypothetical protein
MNSRLLVVAGTVVGLAVPPAATARTVPITPHAQRVAEKNAAAKKAEKITLEKAAALAVAAPADGRASRAKTPGGTYVGMLDGTPAGAGMVSREGVRLEATIARGSVPGGVVLSPGVRRRFDAVRVAPPGSFYEIEIDRGVTRFLGGWIEWERGWTLGYLDPAPVVQLGRHAARAESRD